MLDTLLDFVSDGGASKTNAAGIAVALVLVITAAVFFAIMYARYQKSRQESIELTQNNLIRRGQLDLRKRCLDVHGNVRPELFCAATARNKESDAAAPASAPAAAAEAAAADAEGGQKKGSVGDQIFETLTSGKLVNMLNTFHVRTKKMASNMQPEVSPLNRLRAERHARMADESVNPLFLMKTQPARTSDDSSSDDDDDNDSSSDADVSEFDKEDVV